MKQLAHRWMASVRRDTVLWVAILLAAASWLAVGPGVPYEEYIDWDTLALLFSLMAVTKGMERAGLFAQMGNALLAKLRSTRQLQSSCENISTILDAWDIMNYAERRAVVLEWINAVIVSEGRITVDFKF